MLSMLSRRLITSYLMVIVVLLAVVPASSVAAFLVGTKQIRKGAVTAAKLHRGSVTAPKLARGAVRSSTIGTGQVTARTLAPNAVTGSAISPGAVTADKLAAGAVADVAHADVVPGASPSFGTGSVRNFSSVSSPATGIYCLVPSAGFSASSHELVASLDASHSPGLPGALAVTVAVVDGGPDCAPGSFEVETLTLGSVLAGLTATNGVGFTAVAG
jgi:hypothetical protein